MPRLQIPAPQLGATTPPNPPGPKNPKNTFAPASPNPNRHSSPATHGKTGKFPITLPPDSCYAATNTALFIDAPESPP
ncbi:MAG: hypothetical protein DVB22_002092 [Verrucomicrobia bacterium]|nr:MAG: hypothetical protein DVB22_002092 [Verrucomicrobiota bacterium]